MAKFGTPFGYDLWAHDSISNSFFETPCICLPLIGILRLDSDITRKVAKLAQMTLERRKPVIKVWNWLIIHVWRFTERYLQSFIQHWVYLPVGKNISNVNLKLDGLPLLCVPHWSTTRGRNLSRGCIGTPCNAIHFAIYLCILFCCM